MSELIDRHTAIEELKSYIVDPKKTISENPDDVFQYNAGIRTAVYVITELRTSSPWRRVDDPPKEYGCYVVYSPYFPWTKAKYVWENGKNHWYSLNGEILCPTHWMPVEPPKEDA